MAARRNRSPQGEARVRGASNFLVDPDLGADVCPAFWRPDQNPGVVLVELSAAGVREFARALHARTILAEAKHDRDHHLVLAGARARHRVLARPRAGRDGYFVPRDRSLTFRLAALGAFHDPGGRQAVGSRKALRPTAFQTGRLSLLLAILDRLHEPSGGSPTVRQIVRDVIVPGLGRERAIEWKTSSHRRQGQRLIAEARRMMATGYRDLLEGRVRPAPSRGRGNDRAAGQAPR